MQTISTCKKRRLLSLTLAAAFVLSLLRLLTLPTSAVEPTYDLSDAYETSRYYDQLLDCELTGDMRQDVLAVAYTQLGYHEGNSAADLDGTNIYGSRNFVEYNRLWGALDNGEGNGTSIGYAWCAAFVSWCLRQSGVPTDIAASEISCQRMINWYRENSTYHTRASGYTPIPGDIIMFRYGGGSGAANHVGFVVGVEGGRVYTIEGNTSGVVGLRSYLINNSTILGYCVPDYTVLEGADYDFPLQGQYEPGEYVTLAASLNVRAGASTAYTKLGTLPMGSTVTVLQCEGEWGRIEFEGREAWICLGYAVMTRAAAASEEPADAAEEATEDEAEDEAPADSEHDPALYRSRSRFMSPRLR